MSKYAKILEKQGSANIYTIVNVVESDSSPGSDYILLPNSPAYGIKDEYNSSTQEFTIVQKENFELKNSIEAQKLLNDSDWAVLSDIGLTDDNLTEWKTYRASIRAIRKNPSSTDDNDFPEKPNIIYS